MSGIIKAGELRLAGSDAKSIAFNFDDMSGKAVGYLDEVRREAGEILTAAKKQAEETKQAAREQGRQAALEAAEETLFAKVDQRLQTLLPSLEQAVASVETMKHAWLKRWEEQAVELAAAIAAKVIRREMDHDIEISRTLIREALELAAGSQHIQLRLNPQDYESLGEQVEGLRQPWEKLAETEVIADESISPGGCKVTTEFGEIDQQIETQLQRLTEELK